MEPTRPSTWLTDLAGPLASRFGDALSLNRDGNAVRWSFAGQSAVIELLPAGTLRATFIDRAVIDGVSDRPFAAAYRARGSYALTQASCAHMVTDLVDFFSGVREPSFTFVDTYPR